MNKNHIEKLILTILIIIIIIISPILSLIPISYLYTKLSTHDLQFNMTNDDNNDDFLWSYKLGIAGDKWMIKLVNSSSLVRVSIAIPRGNFSTKEMMSSDYVQEGEWEWKQHKVGFIIIIISPMRSDISTDLTVMIINQRREISLYVFYLSIVYPICFLFIYFIINKLVIFKTINDKSLPRRQRGTYQ